MSHDDLLARIGQSTEETEFYTPMPDGYRPGHHKYVIVVGTVISGLGKGIFSSSMATTRMTVSNAIGNCSCHISLPLGL